MKQDFENKKDALMTEVRSVLGDVEELYKHGVESGSEEAKALKSKLQDKLEQAKSKLSDFECHASEKIKSQVKELKKGNAELDLKIRDFMCANFFDVRTFGANIMC